MSIDFKENEKLKQKAKVAGCLNHITFSHSVQMELTLILETNLPTGGGY